MFKLMTPIEFEVATTPEGIDSVKLSRERFYDKNTQDYHHTASQILGCHIIHGNYVMGCSPRRSLFHSYIFIVNDYSK